MNARNLKPFRLVVLAAALWLGAAGLCRAQLPVYPHPDAATTGQTFYPLSQAYYAVSTQANATFVGERRVRTADVVAGRLDLASRPDPNDGGAIVIDMAAFATFKANSEHSPVPVVEPNPDPTKPHLSPRLTIEVPASALYGDVYPGDTFLQGASGTRTHHLLAGLPPGTKFTLDIYVDCTSKSTGESVRHIDRWTWQIVASFESLRALIDLAHKIPVGRTAFPPLSGENAYRQIVTAVDQIQAKVNAGNTAGAKADIAALHTALASLAAAGHILSTRDIPEVLGYEAIGVELEAIDSQLP